MKEKQVTLLPSDEQRQTRLQAPGSILLLHANWPQTHGGLPKIYICVHFTVGSESGQVPAASMSLKIMEAGLGRSQVHLPSVEKVDIRVGT